MTVGLIKRLLTFLNIAAVLGIAGTAYGFWSHRSGMQKPYKPPSFNATNKVQRNRATRIDSTVIQLGLFPREESTSEAAAEVEEKVRIEAEIDKLGTIKGAITVDPPYRLIKPAIIFEYKVPPAGIKEKVITVQVGEALVTRPHSDPARREWGDRENVRFTFLGSEPDPKRPGRTLFVFDVNGDGKDIQKARWMGEMEKTGLKAAEPDKPKDPDRDTFVRPSDWRDRIGQKKPAAAKPGPRVEAAPVAPRPARRARGTELRGPIFEQRKGTFEATSEGLEYLRNNQQELLKGATTSEYRAPDGTRGIKVRRIAGRTRAVADQFGLMEGDVILSVNGKRVGSKAQAVGIVKRELNAKARFIEVKILRFGKTKTLRFDARDPETRRRATKAFR